MKTTNWVGAAPCLLLIFILVFGSCPASELRKRKANVKMQLENWLLHRFSHTPRDTYCALQKAGKSENT